MPLETEMKFPWQLRAIVICTDYSVQISHTSPARPYPHPGHPPIRAAQQVALANLKVKPYLGLTSARIKSTVELKVRVRVTNR